MASYPYQYVKDYSTPTTPQQASPWEVDQNQVEMFLQQQVPQTYEPHPIIQLEEQPLPEPDHILPSHQRHEHSSHSYSVQLGSEGRSESSNHGEVKSHHGDASRHSTSPAGSSSMPIRRPKRPRVQTAHPYRRSPSTAPANTATTATTTVRTREQQHVRFASPPVVTSASSRSLRTVGPSVPTTSTASSIIARCALIHRFVSGFPIPRRHNISRNTSPTTGAATPSQEAPPTRRFIITSDVYFDVDSKVLSAMLELPGVKKADLSIKLSTCFYNRVKQVTVSGQSKPAFPEDGNRCKVRERKYGEFTRTFAVPQDTQVRFLPRLLYCSFHFGLGV